MIEINIHAFESQIVFFFNNLQINWINRAGTILSRNADFESRSWLHELVNHCLNAPCTSRYMDKNVDFIYILDSSNSTSFSFWSSRFAFSFRSNWNGVSNRWSNGSWTNKHSYHFSTAKEIRVNCTFFFKLLKWCWNHSQLVIFKWWTYYSHFF